MKQQLDQGNPVWIAIRPTHEEPNHITRFGQIDRVMFDAGYTYGTDYVISQLPFDLASVNTGRDVGYGIVSWTPPDDVADVSASEILDGG